jgi:ubiquinone/menaquinone biosynthesis C-methylase UbiE
MKNRLDTNQKLTIQAYDSSADHYMNTIGKLPNYDGTYDFIADMLPENARALDLACGPANISRYLLNKKNLDITGYDLSESMLAMARKTIPEGKFVNRSISSIMTHRRFVKSCRHWVLLF